MAVEKALRTWFREQGKSRPDLRAFGFFGSYARGDWGPGSDLDLVALVQEDEAPFIERSRNWPLEKLPVPASILVYTLEEWENLQAEGGRFSRVLRAETIWLTPPPASSLPGQVS